MSDVVLAIHGGMADPARDVQEGTRRVLEQELRRALETGYQALQQPTGTALDGVEAAIKVLEDSPYFNAGKGAVFTHERRNELDASIMDGKTLKAGAVASVTTIKNPIGAARRVMEQTRHVLLIGPGAERFAQSQGLEIVDPSYFQTPERLRDIDAILNKKPNGNQSSQSVNDYRHQNWGTVGAVALDRTGNLAAGTSTGGLTNKMAGRVGDSPIIGAGTYADNQACAISCTGQGEFFIRYAVSHDVVALIKYRGLNVQQAVDTVILEKLKPAGGEGGAIALDPQGRFAASQNSDGLYRGYVTKDGKSHVILYDAEGV